MTGRPHRLRAEVLALAAVLGTALPLVSGSAPTSATGAPPGADHACIVAGSGHPVIDWPALANPIYSWPTAAVKDEALVWTAGRWHLLFSYLRTDPTGPGGVRWDVATATSPDLARWSAPHPWPAQAGTLGVASPDVVRRPSGGFVVTYQSDPGEPGGGQDKLYYRTTPDLVRFSAPRPLAHSLHPAAGDRMIDGALAVSPSGLMLGYKVGVAGDTQAFEIARSASGSLDGPWTVIGRPAITVNGGTVENYEFVGLGDHWALVATSNNLDQPFLFSMPGDPSRAGSWLRWSPGRLLEVPAGSWDSGPGISSVGFEHANSAYLCDARAVDGHYYLLYAGSPELTAFGGWGHAAIGVARSTDLVHWSVPAG